VSTDAKIDAVAVFVAVLLFWPVVFMLWSWLHWRRERIRTLGRLRRRGGYIRPSQLVYGSGSLATDGLARTSTGYRIHPAATPGLTALAERLKTGSPTGSGSDTAYNPGAPTTDVERWTEYDDRPGGRTYRVKRSAGKIVQIVPENIYPHPWDGEHERPGAA